VTACDVPARLGLSTERLLRLYTTAPGAFWRHDVDVSLEAAAKMARFAQLAGVQATFYVMPRGEFYNPFSRAGEDALQTIHECGHRIGIHVDYRNGGVHQAVARDQNLMLSLRYVNFDLVSFHMPPPEVLWRDFAGFENAYASQWEGRYLSDARREWDDTKEQRVSDDMQIALHPEHWFS
jgi:hypothetical protein